ncbi:FAD-binding oxidoreductase [Roseobacter sp. YSTF-M11]|uniref:FAD-binding oxidoreductase n=1 Tax=Roseobacter insulae TaxID=2859783 RepID=A0A9X1K0X6_9RHOB|nr:FAD-binding oxidoreductase [Roseobacter insulae]MBW4706963.1 FAD-binding oxidoreductase [Roseobacter insulae]
MKRIFSDYAYGEGPRTGCWWNDTCAVPDRPSLAGAHSADVCIIGAGFTGLSAALHLARAGKKVILLEAHYPGWGASGRNGGFCCLGGSMVDDGTLDARVGRAERLAYRAAEKAAVETVADLLGAFGMEVDRHSQGETQLAHRAKDMEALRAEADRIVQNYGVEPHVIEKDALAGEGLAGPFYGAVTTPVGFALNPMKYITQLAEAAQQSAAQLFHDSPVSRILPSANGYLVKTGHGEVAANQVIVATNGYSSEDVPPWLAGRYMPGQSNVLVTRPLTRAELHHQGWSSDQMSFDTRNLLHYFRLMPDRRFLFGMRGGLLTGPDAEARARRRIRRDFEKIFPAWAEVETTHSWSGMVCLARNRTPFVGEVPGSPGLWTGMCYHGNGVAMGTLSGRILADLLQGKSPPHYPAAMRQPLAKFPFGRSRRIVMPPIYAGLMVSDL